MSKYDEDRDPAFCKVHQTWASFCMHSSISFVVFSFFLFPLFFFGGGGMFILMCVIEKGGERGKRLLRV